MTLCTQIKSKLDRLNELMSAFENERRKPGKLRNMSEIMKIEASITGAVAELRKFALNSNIERIADSLGIDQKTFAVKVDDEGCVSFKTFFSEFTPRPKDVQHHIVKILCDRRCIVNKLFFTDQLVSEERFNVDALCEIIQSEGNKITNLRVIIQESSIDELEPLKTALKDEHCKITELEVQMIQELNNIYRLEQFLSQCEVHKIILKTSGLFPPNEGIRNELFYGLEKLILEDMHPAELIIVSHSDFPDQVKSRLHSVCAQKNIKFSFELI
jgi:hypothetical protein